MFCICFLSRKLTRVETTYFLSSHSPESKLRLGRGAAVTPVTEASPVAVMACPSGPTSPWLCRKLFKLLSCDELPAADATVEVGLNPCCGWGDTGWGALKPEKEIENEQINLWARTHALFQSAEHFVIFQPGSCHICTSQQILALQLADAISCLITASSVT